MYVQYVRMLCTFVLYDVYPAHLRLLLHKDLLWVAGIHCELAAPPCLSSLPHSVPGLWERQYGMKLSPEISLWTMLGFVDGDYRQFQLPKDPEQYKEYGEVKLPLLLIITFALPIQKVRERCLIK